MTISNLIKKKRQKGNLPGRQYPYQRDRAGNIRRVYADRRHRCGLMDNKVNDWLIGIFRGD